MFNKAKNKALNNGQNYHFAAILIRNGNPIKIGTNSRKTHPKYKRIHKSGYTVSSMHAEMDVVRFAKPGDVMHVIRFVSDGLAMAKPCEDCMKHIQDAGIKKVFYTNENGEFELLKI